jgi:hypothetical protein
MKLGLVRSGLLVAVAVVVDMETVVVAVVVDMETVVVAAVVDMETVAAVEIGVLVGRNKTNVG